MFRVNSNSLQRVEQDSDLEKFNGKIMAYTTNYRRGDEYRMGDVMFAHVFKGEKYFHIDPARIHLFTSPIFYNLGTYRNLQARFPVTAELIELEEKVSKGDVVFCAYVDREVVTEQLEETCKREFWLNRAVREFL